MPQAHAFSLLIPSANSNFLLQLHFAMTSVDYGYCRPGLHEPPWSWTDKAEEHAHALNKYAHSQS